MKRLVVLLYKDVFAFLCYSMKWYSSWRNRFRTAFDNQFYTKNVEQRVKGIQLLVQRVRDEMTLMNDRLVQDIHSEQKTGIDEIKDHMINLHAWLDAKFQGLGAQVCETLKANAQHAIDIQRWLQAPQSCLLWVEGPAYGPFDEALSSIGTRIQTATEEVGTNCVSFYAKTTYSFEPQLGSVKNAGIISMIYSIISQLIRIAPVSLPNTPDLVEDRIRQLDGKLETIPASLEILEVLLSHMDPGLVVVICGFHLIDSREDITHLVKFAEILRDQALERRVKTLFVSAGNCRALSGSIDKSNRSDASKLSLARPQIPLPGGIAVDSIRLGT
ncbi:hypothetical protein PG994_013616 [Apiospora phragmitis]|uniref:Uncharacterized protein n=1 Tax=Apiospora phragmitis TaxID=2905665 RepID=A0ABR1T985_9PEZI